MFMSDSSRDKVTHDGDIHVANGQSSLEADGRLPGVTHGRFCRRKYILGRREQLLTKIDDFKIVGMYGLARHLFW
jgi:hypothetical protein